MLISLSQQEGSASSTQFSTEELLHLLERYNIGKKPLSQLLGWGQTTILRYTEGITPTPEYSRELRRIAENPTYYHSLLLANKDKITELAYRKSLAAVQELLTESRLLLIAQYIINRAGGDISARRVQAILYYSQCFSLALHKGPLFEEECLLYATEFIPYPVVYHTMRKSSPHVIDLPKGMLSTPHKSLIDHIFNALEWYGPETIRLTTSLERRSLRKSVQPCDEKNTAPDVIGIVTKAVLESYFSRVLQEYNIRKPSEINSYFNKRYIEYRQSKK